MFALSHLALFTILLKLASPVEASVKAVGSGGVLVAPGSGGSAWTTETEEISEMAVGQWSVKGVDGRVASCKVRATGRQLVTFTFSPSPAGGTALDLCGCHIGSHIICSYDDTQGPLTCPSSHPGWCEGGTGGVNDGQYEDDDGTGAGDDSSASGGFDAGDDGSQEYPIENGSNSGEINAGSGAGSDSGSNSLSSSGDGKAVGGAQETGGSGWTGDILDPKTTAQYTGPTLDDLLAMPSSLVAVKIGPQADIIDAIRKVSAEKGVPSGLLAAMIIQESNADRSTVTTNSGYGSASPSPELAKDVGIIQSPLFKFLGDTPEEKLKNGQDPYQNLSVFADEAAANYARFGSWGQVAQFWYTGFTAERLGGVTGGDSLETNYVLNVFTNLAMGGTSYEPAGGYPTS